MPSPSTCECGLRSGNRWPRKLVFRAADFRFSSQTASRNTTFRRHLSAPHLHTPFSRRVLACHHSKLSPRLVIVSALISKRIAVSERATFVRVLEESFYHIKDNGTQPCLPTASEKSCYFSVHFLLVILTRRF